MKHLRPFLKINLPAWGASLALAGLLCVDKETGAGFLASCLFGVFFVCLWPAVKGGGR